MEIINIKDHKELINKAAKWFSSKWNIPQEEYINSMNESLNTKNHVPQWYLCLDDKQIVGGLGVIENDFHERKDLTPNVCAVFVEEPYRNQKIAGRLLNYACEDMAKNGIDTLYLVTNHTSFYQRYGWKYYCDVKCDGDDYMSFMYIHKKGL